MSGFFTDDENRNPGAGDPWKKGQRDRALNDYFNGGHPKQIGLKYKHARMAFLNSILNKLKADYKGKASRYQPTKHREDRTGKRWTPNELDFVRFQIKQKVPITITSTIIQRPVEEIKARFHRKSTADADYKKDKAVARIKTKLRTTDIKNLVTGLDIVWALRYAYFGWKKPIVSDKEYDALVIDECEYGNNALKFEQIKTHLGWPHYIKCLTEFLATKGEGKAVIV